MNQLLKSTDSTNEDIFTRICHAIEKDGYIILSNVFSDEVLNQLFVHLIELNPHEFERAGRWARRGFSKESLY